MTPAIGTRPSDGLMPDAPCAADGNVIEPPVSSPNVAQARRPTVAVPEPCEEPPGV
jgi:hypothetical protein